ncbi:MAG: tetratricopeptide repeat protein [Candidatus Obscuribacterales bacterium]|nr:tetratricopeptide repeat protein [Candidatus Obscuribacterales bacterium]
MIITTTGLPASIIRFFDSAEVWKRIYIGSKIVDGPIMYAYAKLDENIVALDQQKKITKVLTFLETTPNAPPEAYLWIAEALVRPLDSLRWLDRATSIWPDDPRLHQAKAKLFAAGDQPEKALQEIDETLKLLFSDLPSRKIRLDCLIKLRRFQEAVDEAMRCDKYEKNVSPHLLFGILDEKLDNRENDAAWMILEAMRSSKAKGYDNAATYSLRAKVLLDIERYDEAIEEATQCLRTSPKDNQALMVRAKAYMAKGQPARAIPDLDKLVQLHPYYITLKMRAKAYAMQQQYAACQRDLTRAIKDNPSFTELYIERARYFLEMKNPRSAITDLNKSISLDKNIAEAYRLRAEAHRLLNQLQDAFRDDVRARQVGKTWEERSTGEK